MERIPGETRTAGERHGSKVTVRRSSVVDAGDLNGGRGERGGGGE